MAFPLQNFIFLLTIFLSVFPHSNSTQIECENDSTCTSTFSPNSFCDSLRKFHCGVKVCSCNSSFTEVELSPGKSECLPIRNLTETCVHSKQCTASPSGSFSQCSESSQVCQCLPDYFPSPENGALVCVQGKSLHERCTFTSECTDKTENSICSRICVCARGYEGILEDGSTKCYKKSVLGDSCENHHLGHCRWVPGAICEESTKTCQCDQNTHVPAGTSRCLPIRHKLNDTCERDSQCTVEGSACRQGLCDCPNTHIRGLHSHRCLPLKNNLGDSCEEDVQCLRRSSSSYHGACRKSKCQCQDGHIFLDGKCHLPAKLGFACDKPEHLCIDDQRRPDNVTCGGYSRVCVCSYGYIETNGKCHQPLKVGEGCEKTEECRRSIEGGVVCREGKCKCDAGYRKKEAEESWMDEPCLQENVPVGGDCEEDWQCMMGECLAGRCHFNESNSTALNYVIL